MARPPRREVVVALGDASWRTTIGASSTVGSLLAAACSEFGIAQGDYNLVPVDATLGGWRMRVPAQPLFTWDFVRYVLRPAEDGHTRSGHEGRF
jgi:hypothetical protein